jgi:hypothetical protein
MCISVDASQHRLNHKSLISPNFFMGQPLTLPSMAIDGELVFTSMPTERQLRAALIERTGSEA